MTDENEPSAGSEPAKPKRKMTEQQLENLRRGRARMLEKREERVRQGDQELVRVNSTQMRPKVAADPDEEAPATSRAMASPAAPPRDISDIANRARARHGEPPLSVEDDDPEQSPSARRADWRSQVDRQNGNGHYPSVEEVAAETEIYSSGGVIPPVESDPRRRDRPTLGAVRKLAEASAALDGDDGPADVSSGKLRSLADLTASYSLDGTGQYEIQVNRIEPKIWGGFPCKGIQRPIRDHITDAEFTRLYGGGEYLLTVYGPPKRGGVFDPRRNRIVPKALTEPVKYSVPQIHAPNPEACVLDDEDDDGYYEDEEDMRHVPQVQMNRSANRPVTPADAKMLEVQLSHEERVEDRRSEREKALAQQLHSLPAQMEPLLRHTIEAVKTSSDQSTQLLQEQARRESIRADRERERAERIAEQAARPSAEISMLSETMKTMVDSMISRRPEDGAELHRLTQQFASERENMHASHTREIERIQNIANEQVRNTNERSESRIRDIEARSQERESRVLSDAERQVREIREASVREKGDIERMYQARLTDESRNHERELRSQETMWRGQMETQKTAFEMRIAQKDDEIRRLQSDADRYRTDAEKNANLPARMQEFAVAAEAMGFSKEGDNAPEAPTWQQMLGQVGLEMVKNLPGIVQSAGDAVRGVRPQVTPEAQYAQMVAQAQQTQPQAMAGGGGHQFPPLPRRRNRMVFNTEGGPDFGESLTDGSGTYVAPMAQAPVAAPANMAPPGLQVQQPAAAAQPAPMWEVPQQVQPMPMMPQQFAQPPAPQMTFPPQQQVAAPQPQQHAPSPQPPATQAPAGGLQVTPDQLRMFVGMFEQAYVTSEDPKNFAEALVEQFGAPIAKQVISGLSVERVVATIQAAPGGAQSPLVRRDGQKFLRSVWGAVKQLVG